MPIIKKTMRSLLSNKFSPNIFTDIRIKIEEVIKTFKMPDIIAEIYLYFRRSLVLSIREYPVIAVFRAIIHGINLRTEKILRKVEKNRTMSIAPNTPARIE